MGSHHDSMGFSIIWLLILLQIILIHTNWWAYNAYYMRPAFNQPQIFWNPLTRKLLLTLPWVGIIGLIVSAFFLTDHPWIFLLFTVSWWGMIGYRGYARLRKQSVESIYGASEKEMAESIYSNNNTAHRLPRHDKDAPTPSKEWLIDQISYSDIISGKVSEVLDKSDHWALPFITPENEEWRRIQETLQADDEIWMFSSMKTGIKSPCHWLGICIIRNGEVVNHISEVIHISYRR